MKNRMGFAHKVGYDAMKVVKEDMGLQVNSTSLSSSRGKLYEKI